MRGSKALQGPTNHDFPKRLEQRLEQNNYDRSAVITGIAIAIRNA
jgi:hypothetical protein